MQFLLKLLDTQLASTPTMYGTFHLVCLALMAVITVVLCILWKKGIIRNPRRVVLVTAVIVALFEIYKQINFSFGYENGITFDYQWYAFPWQFCSTPLYYGLLAGLTKKGKLHKSFCAYLATYAFFAGLAVMLYPSTVFTSTLGICVQTMICHGSMVVIAIFLYYSGYVKAEWKTLKRAVPVFILNVGVAILLNELAHYTNFTGGETFNMFFISRHFESDLPVYSIIHNALVTPGDPFSWKYVLCVLLYIFGFAVCAAVMLAIPMLIKKFNDYDFDERYAEQDKIEREKAYRRAQRIEKADEEIRQREFELNEEREERKRERQEKKEERLLKKNEKKERRKQRKEERREKRESEEETRRRREEEKLKEERKAEREKEKREKREAKENAKKKAKEEKEAKKKALKEKKEEKREKKRKIKEERKEKKEEREIALKKEREEEQRRERLEEERKEKKSNKDKKKKQEQEEARKNAEEKARAEAETKTEAEAQAAAEAKEEKLEQIDKTETEKKTREEKRALKEKEKQERKENKRQQKLAKEEAKRAKKLAKAEKKEQKELEREAKKQERYLKKLEKDLEKTEKKIRKIENKIEKLQKQEERRGQIYTERKVAKELKNIKKFKEQEEKLKAKATSKLESKTNKRKRKAEKKKLKIEKKWQHEYNTEGKRDIAEYREDIAKYEESLKENNFSPIAAAVTGVFDNVIGKVSAQADELEAERFGKDITKTPAEREKEPAVVAQHLRYRLRRDDKSYAVSGYDFLEHVNIIIPAEHNGMPVKRIDAGAFECCHELVSAVVPEGVEKIGSLAFAYCTEMKLLTLPASITELEVGAFYDCRSLEMITYESTLDDWKKIERTDCTNSSTRDHLIFSSVTNDYLWNETNGSVNFEKEVEPSLLQIKHSNIYEEKASLRENALRSIENLSNRTLELVNKFVDFLDERDRISTLRDIERLQNKIDNIENGVEKNKKLAKIDENLNEELEALVKRDRVEYYEKEQKARIDFLDDFLDEFDSPDDKIKAFSMLLETEHDFVNYFFEECIQDDEFLDVLIDHLQMNREELKRSRKELHKEQEKKAKLGKKDYKKEERARKRRIKKELKAQRRQEKKAKRLRKKERAEHGKALFNEKLEALASELKIIEFGKKIDALVRNRPENRILGETFEKKEGILKKIFGVKHAIQRINKDKKETEKELKKQKKEVAELKKQINEERIAEYMEILSTSDDAKDELRRAIRKNEEIDEAVEYSLQEEKREELEEIEHQYAPIEEDEIIDPMVKRIKAKIKLRRYFRRLEVIDEAYLESDNVDLEKTNDFLEAYFESLTQNFGRNEFGTCGYVALAMLLSYYDVVFDDRIVPSKYEKHTVSSDFDMFRQYDSPGSLFMSSGVIKSQTLRTYLDYVNETKDVSLHSKLVSIGEFKKPHGEYLDLSIEENDSNMLWGTTYPELIRVLDEYLESRFNFVKPEYKIDGIDSSVIEDLLAKSKEGGCTEADYQMIHTAIRRFTITKIREGTPVLLGISKSEGGVAHVVIAYDYDEDNDVIYCHMGWEFDKYDEEDRKLSHYDFRNHGFDTIDYAITLDFEDIFGVSTPSKSYEVAGVGKFAYDDETIITCNRHVHPIFSSHIDNFDCKCSLNIKLNSDATGYIVRGIDECTDNFIEIPKEYNGLPILTIYDWAFEYCTKVVAIEIPEGVEYIGVRAFDNCKSLREIILPSTIKTIEECAFGECASLDVIHYMGTMEQWTQIYKGAHWDTATGKYHVHCLDGTLIKGINN